MLEDLVSYYECHGSKEDMKRIAKWSFWFSVLVDVKNARQPT